MTRMSSLLCMSALTRRHESAFMSCASSITSTVLPIWLCSTSPVSIISAALVTTLFTSSRLPMRPSSSKQKEWNVMMSTKCAALPMSCMSRCLNSVAAAREKVSMSSCSCFTSSSNRSEASLCTSTRVLPLPGPAATTMQRDSWSLMMAFCLSERSSNSCLNFAGLMLRSISLARSPLKYLSMNRR